jgi:pimeloyl-ACP methyl ester carboxylesterase
MNFTPAYLATIQARTLIVQGDRDPLARSIPHPSLWIIPSSGHPPVFGDRWPEFQKTATAFLQD